MATGRPIVSSSSPLQGLSVEANLQILKADTPDEWVDRISSVFEDNCRAEELGMAASAWVQLNHRWSNGLDPLIDMIDSECSEPEPELEVES